MLEIIHAFSGEYKLVTATKIVLHKSLINCWNLWIRSFLVIPLYGVKDPGIIFQDLSDKVSGIDAARELQLADKARDDEVLALTALKINCA